MNTYIYSKFVDDNITIETLSLPAINLEKAKEKLISVYFNKFDDLDEPINWDSFVDDLWNKHGILLSHPRDVEEL